MLRLLTIDLSDADLSLFEAYERTAMAQLEKYGARLEWRVRSRDGTTETHLLNFPNEQAYEAFLADPARDAARKQWDHCGAVATNVEVTYFL